MKNKKAQSETVGFVLIIIIVAIIGLGFFWFMLHQKDSEIPRSSELSNLLQSEMYFTSDCAINFIPQYLSGEELLTKCYLNENEYCLNGKSICDSLNENLMNISVNSLNINENSPNKAFKLYAYYLASKSAKPDYFLNISSGNFKNCSAVYQAIESKKQDIGAIDIKIEICKANA